MNQSTIAGMSQDIHDFNDDSNFATLENMDYRNGLHTSNLKKEIKENEGIYNHLLT